MGDVLSRTEASDGVKKGRVLGNDGRGGTVATRLADALSACYAYYIGVIKHLLRVYNDCFSKEFE